MSKVITFSRTFPSYHPKAGEPTYFVEKVWESLIQTEVISLSRCCELSRQTGIGELTMNSIRKIKHEPKHHTIRAGHRWKAGDWFSPRVWSGKPYASKQITIAPDIQIKKTWNFDIHAGKMLIDNNPASNWNGNFHVDLALNDGLTVEDMHAWFKFPKPFDGQIICWNDKIEY